MTKSYFLVFLEDNYNITNHCLINDNYILYSLRNGDDFIEKKIETIVELDNIVKNYLLFIPDVLKSGFYRLEEIKDYLEKEKIGINYPNNLIEFFDIIDNEYSNLSNLIFLEYIYNKMVKNNYKIIHILYE
jgi:hypothetical protein